MKNEYKMKDEICEVYCYYKGEKHTIIIDREAFDVVNSYSGRWYMRKDGYPYGRPKINGEYVLLSLQRFLMKPKKDEVVDHINRDKNDYRRSNLRVIPKNKNQQNISIYGNRRNTSGHRNIRVRKQPLGTVYVVEMARKYIGTYKSLDEAITARNKALIELQPYCYEAIKK